MRLPRRDVLIGGAATAGLAACGGMKAPDGPRLDPKANTLTVKFIDPATGEARFEQTLSPA